MRYSLFVTFLATVFVAGCNQQPATAGASASPIDQSQVCEVKDWQRDLVASACKPGQKMVFLPRTWGNAQLPILFAAVNCDLRYAVALTEGAVTCIYNPIQPAPVQPASVDASQPIVKP